MPPCNLRSPSRVAIFRVTPCSVLFESADGVLEGDGDASKRVRPFSRTLSNSG